MNFPIDEVYRFCTSDIKKGSVGKRGPDLKSVAYEAGSFYITLGILCYCVIVSTGSSSSPYSMQISPKFIYSTLHGKTDHWKVCLANSSDSNLMLSVF